MPIQPRLAAVAVAGTRKITIYVITLSQPVWQVSRPTSPRVAHLFTKVGVLRIEMLEPFLVVVEAQLLMEVY